MTTNDFDAFLVEFKRVSAAFDRFKQSPSELAARADVYFHILKRFPLSLVVAKADAWLEHETKFPKPAEWANQIIVRRIELRQLSEAESSAYLRAESLGFEDAPCDCSSCVQAGLPERAEHRLRYAPIDLADGRPDRARVAGTDTIVTPGRWLHGWELVRWYTARATFWSTAYAKCGIGEKRQRALERVPFAERLERIFAKRGEMPRADGPT